MNFTRRHAILFAVTLLSTCVYWRTAYPTITWWDSSSHSLAAATMGIASPPGSLLLTLLGWPVAHLPLGLSTAHVLNLFAGVLAALCVALVYVVARSILRSLGYEPHWSLALGIALGAATFAFSPTLWEHAIKFTPYVLTAVFTGLILLTMVRWWNDADNTDAWRHIALLGLLIGLDFSVHRTNALLAPGILAWIAIRSPGTLRQARTWIVGTGALLAGLTVQLLAIPISRSTNSPINWHEIHNLSSLWDYVSLKQLGGGFLLQLFPRKSDLWSAQFGDFLRVLGQNFLHVSGGAGALGLLPAFACVGGIAVMWRRSRMFGAAFTLVLLLQAAMTVFYFNIPAGFFRTFDRHYLPVCVTIGIAIACGLGAAMRLAVDLATTRGHVLSAAGAVVLALMPAAQLTTNWRAYDASRRYFTEDYARNALQALPPHAIYVTVGDNDTFPVLYVQAVEGVRPDVQILNFSLAYTPQYLDLLLHLDPTFPLAMSRERRYELYAGRAMLGDSAVADVIRTNRSRRPIAFALTGAKGGMGAYEPYTRLDGLYWSIVAEPHPPDDANILRANLSKNEYRGFADSSVLIDNESRTMGSIYFQAILALLNAEAAGGHTERCAVELAEFQAMVPVERLRLPPEDVQQLKATCGPR